MAQRIVGSLCALLALVAWPVDASATGFRGKTSQKRAVSVVTGADGLVTRIRVSYDAPCTDPRYRFPNVMRFGAPFTTLTPVLVTDQVTLRTRLKGGGRVRQTATIVAHFDGTRWSGIFRTRAILTRSGRRLDKCELKRVTWTASS